MGKRIAIGAAWWLAFAYFWEFSAAMYGWPLGVGPVLALVVATAVVVSPRELASKLAVRVPWQRRTTPGLATEPAVRPERAA